MKVESLVDCGKLNPRSFYQGHHGSAPLMPEFQISKDEITKLVCNLKPAKAAISDQIRPLILKELRNEISPIIKVPLDFGVGLM